MKKLIFSKFSKFIYGGVMSYALRLGITAFLTELFGVWYFLSYIVALVCAVVVNFFYNVHITFKVKKNKKMFARYVVFFFIFMFVDAALVKIFTDLVGIYYLVSIIITTTILFIAKFFVYQKWCFLYE